MENDKVAVDRPPVEPGDWIYVGDPNKHVKALSAVVCQVFLVSPPDIEVVYLDRRNRAINTDLVWKEGHWEFAHPQPDGGYADIYPRLAKFVAQLRRGRDPGR